MPKSFLNSLRLEPRLEVALEHALAVHFEHAALREPAQQRLAHLRRIDAGLARRAIASATTASVPPSTIWLQTLQI